MNEQESIVITPPDILYVNKPSILMVDVEEFWLTKISDFLSTAKLTYALHLYGHHDSNTDWLLQQAAASDLIILNMDLYWSQEQPITGVFKGYMLSMEKTSWYGNVDNWMPINQNRMNDPLEIFVRKEVDNGNSDVI